MKKLILLLFLLVVGFAVNGYCDSVTCYQSGIYVVTLNTTTFTSVTTGRKNYFYNPGAYDIKLATASDSATTARWTVKAASYLPFPVEINASYYALATDTHSVTLENLTGK